MNEEIRVTVEGRGVRFGQNSKRKDMKDTWMIIYLGVLIGVTLVKLLDMPFPPYLNTVLLLVAASGYVICWARYFFQKTTCQFAFKAGDRKMKFIWFENRIPALLEETEDVVGIMPIFKKYSYEKIQKDGQTTFVLSGVPTEMFAGFCDFVISIESDLAIFMQKTSKVRMEILVPEGQEADWEQRVPEQIVRSHGRMLRVPKKERKVVFLDENKNVQEESHEKDQSV